MRLTVPAGRGRRLLLFAMVGAGVIAASLPIIGLRWQIGIDPQVYRCLPEVHAVLIDLATAPKARGELVSFEARGLEPAFPDGRILVKILAGIPGDRVDIDANGVRINGTPAASGLALAQVLGHSPETFARSFTIPDGFFFALGTGPRSLDSRYYGPVPTSRIRGKAWALW